MSTRDIIFKRRCVREFLDKEIGDDIIKDLLECGMAGPSACNKKPWEFYVITNKEKIQELKGASRFANRDCQMCIVVCGNKKRFLAPTKPNDFWIQDCAAACENIFLRATELGLGMCWCGLFPMITPVNRTIKLLGLDENTIPMALLQIGYPNETKEPRTQYDEKCVHYIR